MGYYFILTNIYPSIKSYVFFLEFLFYRYISFIILFEIFRFYFTPNVLNYWDT